MNHKLPTLLVAILPIALLIALLAANVITFGDDALSYANQIALLISTAVAGVIGLLHKRTYADLIEGVSDNIHKAVPAIMVLLLIGALAGSWLISGVIPAMIFYGLKILHPSIFLFACCVIAAIVSLASGSSWGTIATVGIALLGIGKTMDFNVGLVAGAIISGAYFGDKMSPLSDTTNLAPAVSGTDLISHIRYMTITTFPSMAITLLIFLVIGFVQSPDALGNEIDIVNAELQSRFNLNPLLFLAPAAVIVAISRRIPAIPSIAIGAMTGILLAFVFQQPMLSSLEEANSVSSYALVLQALGSDLGIPANNPVLADLLSTGGMKGMLNTVWLILCAMAFGGVMERSGCLTVITQSLLKLATGRTSLIGTTAMSSVIMNFTASDQYLAIVVPGKMFEQAYHDRKLHAVNLSRTLEDAGTVTSVLIPWNTCGATQAGVLGVATAVYWPFCFFCLISPVMTLAVAAFNYRIKTTEQ
ncbi:MAG: Na+/H+ antiporter NhaC [Flavobacteriales bacterium]